MAKRETLLAGTWYPGTESGCRRKIEEMLGATPERTGRGGIVPHAGWDYSGAFAIEVFQALAAADPAPELLLLFGTHMAPHSAPHISLASAFETPLGTIAAAEDLAVDLARELDLRPDPADTRGGGGDNTIEVQLPFIKYLLPNVELLVISPPATIEAIELGREAARLAGQRGRPMAVVGSTDLTHYGARFGFSPAGTGEAALRWVEKENDARVVERILHMDPKGVVDEARQNHNACVPGAVAATISAVQEFGINQADLLRYGTSWDVQPGGDTFVGYAAILFS